MYFGMYLGCIWDVFLYMSLRILTPPLGHMSLSGGVAASLLGSFSGTLLGMFCITCLNHGLPNLLIKG